MWRKILLFAVLSSPFWDLGHPLWELDDARYAEVPREMVAGGDWLTPHLNYFDYVEKPPLIYWLGAVSYRLFGVNEAAARLPLAALASLGLLGVWWLGSWLFSAEVGLCAALILGTSLEFFILGHLITPDMALSVFLLWATAFLLRALERPQDARWAAPAGWAALGLAFLSKGLVALLLPALWIGALAASTSEVRPKIRTLIPPFGLGVFAAIALPWFAAMEARHPGFLHFFFIEQHFMRYLTPQYTRGGPWYYFLATEAGGSLPWTPLILAGLLLPLTRWRETDFKRRSLALWVLIVLAFFSASKSKLTTYILPVFAHQSILGAEFFLRGEKPPKAELRCRWTAAALAALLAIALLAALVLAGRASISAEISRPMLYGGAVCAGLLALSLGVLALNLPGERKILPAVALAAAANALLLAGARRASDVLSSRDLAREIAARLKPQDRIISYNLYLHGIAFYTRHPVDLANLFVEFSYAKRMGASPERFGSDATIRALPDPGRRTFVVVKNAELPYFAALTRRSAIKRLKAFGSWALAEF